MSDFSKKKAAVLFACIFIIIMAVLIIGFGLFLMRPAKSGGAEQVVILREGFGERHGMFTDTALLEIGIDPARRMEAGYLRGGL